MPSQSAMFAKNSRLIQPGRTRTTGSASASGRPVTSVVSLIPHQLPVPVERVLRRPPQGLVVDVHQAEARRVTLGPFKIVHQGPAEVPPDVNTGIHRLAQRDEVAVQEVDAFGVVHTAVFGDDV